MSANEPLEPEYLPEQSKQNSFAFTENNELVMCVQFYKSLIQLEGCSEQALVSLDKLVQVAYSFGVKHGADYTIDRTTEALKKMSKS